MIMILFNEESLLILLCLHNIEVLMYETSM